MYANLRGHFDLLVFLFVLALPLDEASDVLNLTGTRRALREDFTDQTNIHSSS